MAGAIAGTAILNCRRQSKLQTVALTINNQCNLSCPHCYLQYSGPESLVSEHILSAIYRAQFAHLAIVGKEPLVSPASRALCREIAENCARTSKSISLITNGLTLASLESDLLNDLAYIDISFDGGPETYHLYRGGSFSKLLSGLAHLRQYQFSGVNALHVINDLTINAVDDMMRVGDSFDFRCIMFSPYIATANHGMNLASEVPLDTILRVMSSSQAFMTDPRAFVLIDGLRGHGEIQSSDVADVVWRYGLKDKVRLYLEDPLLYGIVRVTYDGFVLTPYESLNPRYYDRSRMVLSSDRSGSLCLENVYEELLGQRAVEAYEN
jgi:hypothetical protein